MERTDQHREVHFERTVHVTGPVSLEINMRSGRIRVRRAEDDAVTIRGTIRARPSIFTWIHPDHGLEALAADPPVQQNGSAIRIGDLGNPWLLRRVHLFLEVTVPAATRVRALGDSGDLRVEGIHGPVDCQTDSGEIQIAEIEERVSASSDSGSISIRAAAGPVDIETDSGDIEALEIAGGIDAHSGSGRIRLSQTVAAPVYARSDSGNIMVKLAPEAGYTIRVSSDRGEIEIPALGKATAGAIRGGGSIVAVETDSGAIEII